MMPPGAVGIDTSNYTTSAALVLAGRVAVNSRLPLPVKPGTLGLRQSDAVFHHVQQLARALEPVLAQAGAPAAVGVSTRPRAVEGSYMPCFTVGMLAANVLAQSARAPLHAFSHQQGHVAAAVYSAGRMDLLATRFLAFHVSGGTTEALLVAPDEDGTPAATRLAASLDLKAGQAVDRVGAMLGLPFPAGPALEELALQWETPERPRPVLRGLDCSLSGLENRCRDLLAAGSPPARVARYCIETIGETLAAMCAGLLREYGALPVVFSGGVSANGILRQKLAGRFGALFAEPAFSADNAAGVALLAARKEGLL